MSSKLTAKTMVPGNIRFMKQMFGIGKMLPLLNYDSRMFYNFPKDFHGNTLGRVI